LNPNDRVLITGGSGFLGGRLVEVLARRGMRLRIATSDFRHCARAARFPVELVKADLRDTDALSRAAAGCDVIFHFAYRFGGAPAEHQRANVEGAKALAEALLKHGGRRLVHISSVSAYGRPRDGDLTETSPYQQTSDTYSNTKRAIDQALLELHGTRGLPVAILQPTIVYGPYAPAWTTRLLEQVRTARVALPADGLGLCNAVYVDDVIAAAILAADRGEALGQTFLISGSAPTTWRDFYGAYENMVGKHSLVYLNEKQVRGEVRRQWLSRSPFGKIRRELARRPAVRDYLSGQPPFSWLGAASRRLPASAQAVLQQQLQNLWQLPSPGTLPLFLPDAGENALFAARLNVRIDKARALLGYDPRFELKHGMALTRDWAEWANLLSD
jgi:nucleoside-diphosphate-sugar epimerase